MPKLLITSIADKIPHLKAAELAIRNSQYFTDLIPSDCDENCIAAHINKNFWKTQPIQNLSPTEFIKECERKEIRAIIPTRSGELDYFASNLDVFAVNNIHILCSNKQAIHYFTNKTVFFEKAKQQFQPNMIPVLERESLNDSYSRFVVKEECGSGSMDLKLGLSAEEALIQSKELLKPIFQPFIQGKEFSADSYVDKKGTCLGTVLRWRNLVRNGESQITQIFRHKKIEEWISRFLEEHHLYGHAVTQGLIQDNGTFSIIETNPRIGGASTASIEAGLDSFSWFLLEASGKSLQLDRRNLKIKELTMTRYKNDTFS